MDTIRRRSIVEQIASFEKVISFNLKKIISRKCVGQIFHDMPSGSFDVIATDVSDSGSCNFSTDRIRGRQTETKGKTKSTY